LNNGEAPDNLIFHVQGHGVNVDRNIALVDKLAVSTVFAFCLAHCRGMAGKPLG
jgi:uncharacterized membrane protein YGL010W